MPACRSFSAGRSLSARKRADTEFRPYDGGIKRVDTEFRPYDGGIKRVDTEFRPYDGGTKRADTEFRPYFLCLIIDFLAVFG